MVEEKYEFTAKAKKTIFIVLGVGVVLTLLGILIMNMGGGHGEAAHGAEAADHGGHAFHWTKRLFANLWINNVFFVGMALIGIFFFALQYAAQAGWSAGVLRIPLAMGNWLIYGGVIMAIVFAAAYPSHALFHWLDSSLYDPASENFDKIIAGKSWYLSKPFYFGRFIVFFLGWWLFFSRMKKLAFQEDLEGGLDKWKQIRSTAAYFLVFFAVSSSMSAWDWIMSIDTHWFSTMFGWYVFASWWVSGLAFITFIVVLLKDKGYLSIVTNDHLHDLGKFIFGFSVFWTYIWFSQFLLIYYAGIPEETIYFVERWKNDHYAPVFFINLIVNFFFPFLVLMTRESKRQTRILKIVCPTIIFGHWLDFYLMITPGTLNVNGGFGLLEIGLIMVYLSAFLFVTLSSLAKAPLFAKNHPMLKESLHHHI